MLTYERALEQLLAAAVPVKKIETVSLGEARGRILAKTQISAIAVPPLDNSAMDGYAVRCADVATTGVSLPIEQRIPAGKVGHALLPGTAARIFTGAPIPPGADTVVIQEHCILDDQDRVVVNQVPTPGNHIRRAGEDIAPGAKVLSAGTRLGPAELGVAASVGLAQLPVRRRMRVALLSTGDELIEPGEPLPPGAIYNSNRPMLQALLEGLGCVVTDLGRIPDNLAATRQALQTAAKGHDLILSTGGVSVGEEDHVKTAVEAEGELALWKIGIKPGKPLAFGKVGAGSTAFIGLPGNPVSGFVTFMMMVRPYILRCMGAQHCQPVERQLVSASDWLRPDMRREFLRARITADGRAELHPNQGSGVLTSCVWADGLIDNPPRKSFLAGDTVRFLSFASLS